jgi:hypothetical protein
MTAPRLFATTMTLLALGAACAPEDEVAANGAVESVIVVGTNVTSRIYQSGEYGLTLVPRDAQGAAVLSDGLRVSIDILSPPGLFTSQSLGNRCAASTPGAGLSVGVIIDDSGSMSGTDPQLRRRDAAIAFIETLGGGDEVLLTDYGVSPNLRDLVCASRQGGVCPATPAGFTNDKVALKQATSLIRASGGTPLYRSCIEMVPLVASRIGRQHAILLLSDGQPGDTNLRAKCHADALAAGVPVYTVGLGPAAEVMLGSDATAVRVLRELATETGATYASANLPEQLMALFANVGTALTGGKCESNARLDPFALLVPGQRIVGRVHVGDNQAVGNFEFVAPAR